MRVPSSLASAFDASFEELIAQYAIERKLLPDAESLQSPRYLARSVIPHVQKLSDLFNRSERLREARLEAEAAAQNRPRIKEPKKSKAASKAEAEALHAAGLDPYWAESSNPANLRLAYFLYFMPANLYRVAAIWAELFRLGYRWPEARPIKGIEFGAGPASGACGIAAGEKHAPCGIPDSGNWALIEQDKTMLDLGAGWAARLFNWAGKPSWETRTFRRKIEFSRGLLPPAAPEFNLWVMSYFLNEAVETPDELADTLLAGWKKHLAEEGIVILSEPALKYQSRRLLELRRSLLAKIEADPSLGIQVLLPCLGHQICGALTAPDDWCHEEVSWWRPPYFKKIDQMAGLDRKTLPFSYLVLIKSSRTREEILPALAGSRPETRSRLVSPAHSEGRDLEFFLCGQDGKRRARFRPTAALEGSAELDRGGILLGPVLRGDRKATRIDRIKKIL